MNGAAERKMQSISRRVSSDLDGQAGGGTRLVRISLGSVHADTG